MSEHTLQRLIGDWLDAELGPPELKDPDPDGTRARVDEAVAEARQARGRRRVASVGLLIAGTAAAVSSVLLLGGPSVRTSIDSPADVTTTRDRGIGDTPSSGSAPSGSAPSIGDTAVPRTLVEAKARWAAAGLRDYTFTVHTSCLCPATSKMTITYRDGRPVLGTAPEDSLPKSGSLPPTGVEQLFAIIEAEQAAAARVSVFYEANGVPAVIKADRILNAADDEIAYTTWVRPVPSPASSAEPVRYRTDAGMVEVLWPGPAAAPSWFDVSGNGYDQSTTDGALDLLAALDRAVPGTSPDAGTASLLGRSAVDPAGYTAELYRVVPGGSAAEQVSWGMTMTRGGVTEPTTVFDPCGRWPRSDGLGLDDGFRSAYFEEYLSDATETCTVTTTPDGRRVVRFTIMPGNVKETPLPGPQLRAFTVRPDGTAVAAVVFARPGMPASNFPQTLDILAELVLDLPYPTRP